MTKEEMKRLINQLSNIINDMAWLPMPYEVSLDAANLASKAQELLRKLEKAI